MRCVYGLEPEQFDALLASQEGVCAICQTLAEGQWNVDHCHDTGLVRGILCSSCNIGIGQLADSVARLQAAIAYLEAPPAFAVLHG